MAPSFPNMSTDAGLKKLNEFLADKSFVEGYTASGADVKLFRQTKGISPDAAKYPNARRWWNLLASLTEARLNWLGGVAASASSAAADAKPKAAAADDDDDVDLFGSDDEGGDEEYKKMIAEKTAKVLERQAGYQNKDKSSIVLDIKPWDDETDLAAMEAAVRALFPGGLEGSGLAWGASKLAPVAFGVKKLQILLTIYDDKISSDDLEEAITGLEDYVQSVDIASWTKV
eukprot:JP446884.1.p1 GENE.JP446884.1~~JP446884.1.p1  ORF type:complete len:243 (-),score=110.43 JP446884.1:75-764(-)